jgi:HEAT repeat protein
MQRIDDLIEQLKSPEVQDRIAAAQALGRLGPGAAAALRPLLNRFAAAEDHAELEAVARALPRIGPNTLPLTARYFRTGRQRRQSARDWARTVGASWAPARARAVLEEWDGGGPDLEDDEEVREAAAEVAADRRHLGELDDRITSPPPVSGQAYRGVA